MFCPTCGSEERQLSQYCRSCGTDLRVVRVGLETPDAITASAVSAREQISRAVADRIRQLESAKDLHKVAEDVLPEIEKFLESPEEKRLRRFRAGIITAFIGVGATIAALVLSGIKEDFLPLIVPGLILFFVGLGVMLNGLLFTLPRKSLREASNQLRQPFPLVDQLSSPSPTSEIPAREQLGLPSSVTEHTTHQLKSQR